MGARSYDPELATFISPDSIIPDQYRPQSLDRYAFVEHRPTDHIDPTGRSRMQVEMRKAQAEESSFGWMYARALTGDCYVVSFCRDDVAPAGPPGKEVCRSCPSKPASDVSEWAQWPGESITPPPLVEATGDPGEWAAWPGETFADPPLVAARPCVARQRSDPSEWAPWPGTPSAPPLVAASGGARTIYRDDQGMSWLAEVGTVPARRTKARVDAHDTETVLQSEVSRLHSQIPAWYELTKMASFDSTFFGDRRIFEFRGTPMAGWEMNYYFVSMALAHQGFSWEATEAIIETWNYQQDLLHYGGGDLTPGMMKAAREGFLDERLRP
jgi:hypothetical protein